jgi:hypothetical protein
MSEQTEIPVPAAPSSADVERAAWEVRAERRDVMRTWFAGITMFIAVIGVIGTVFIAHAAHRGIETLQARKERDEARTAQAAADARTVELKKANSDLQRQIDEGYATLAELNARVERLRVSELQAKAKADAADAKRRASDADAKRYQLYADFYGEVVSKCVTDASSAENREQCVRNVRISDASFSAIPDAVVRPVLPPAATAPRLLIASNSPPAGSADSGGGGYSDLLSLVALLGLAALRALAGPHSPLQ